ncbi:MAG: xanthine dehydrogenase family protein subunit M [Candidatus Bipolaricaulis sp.]|nr:xanthine dehydrogenase family protein subunit M [Candidatus Bipolaricaulis sp.]
MLRYVRVDTEADLLDALRKDGARLLSGGTDLIVKMRSGLVQPKSLVDPAAVPELRGIETAGGDLRIGAATPLAEILASREVGERAPLLADVLRVLGCVQIRNRGTLGGNLANASPAADSAIPLLLYEATLEVVGEGGTRSVPVDGFFLGPGRTVLERGEYIRAVHIPASRQDWITFFHKVGRRRALTIAIASVGGLAAFSRGSVAEVRLAAGSVAPIPLRLRSAEERLAGRALDEEAVQRAGALAAEEVSPIDDVRATARYRREVTRDLVARFLAQAAGA